MTLAIGFTELPPGPNRLFLHEPGDCTVPRGELLAAEPLAVVNVTTNESGAEPLKTARVVAGMTVAQMAGRALVVYRGSQLADAGPTVTGQPRLAACGVIQ